MNEEMSIKIHRRTFKGHILNAFENNSMVFGFTEKAFPLSVLVEYFQEVSVVQLKQIHSDIILFSDQIQSESSGDGIILNQRNCLALIKTADCIPLSFWDETTRTGGIIHVGWRGLCQRIETKLLQILRKIRVNREKLLFYIGPSIEQKCYPVGPEIYESFSSHSFRDEVFHKKSRGEFNLDLRMGLTLSLINSGIRPEQILNSGICNFCESKRFPSFRRHARSGCRIYNFILLK